MNAHAKRVEEVLRAQGTLLERGLTPTEVAARQHKFGRNELVAKHKINPLKIFISQFKSFIIYILLFAVLVSIAAREYIDATVILVILIFNSLFGFFQEYKAEKAIDALKKLSGLKAKVIRNGKEESVETSELVPGDIIILEAGSKVPADARLCESFGLEAMEASLTGESVPVSKHCKPVLEKAALAERKNMVFSGTAITKGRAKAIIVATGMRTEIGHIAGMVSEETDELTPLQRDLEKLGKWIGIVTITICLIVFIAGIFKEGLVSHLLRGDILGFLLASKQWFLTAISLAVAAVPEGLPIVVTIALAIGTRKLLRKNVLIRKLPSVETLGETNVICTDKTGTLTSNEMTVRKVYVNNKIINFSGEGYSLEGKPDKPLTKHDHFIFNIGVLCNESGLIKQGDTCIAKGDPTEVAFYVSAGKAGIDYDHLRKTWKLIDEKSFDSVRKLMSTIHIEPTTKKKYVLTKGAPEAILDRCNKILLNGKVLALDNKTRNNILKQNDRFAEQALRVLGFAYKIYNQGKGDIEQNLIFVGLQAMMDPPHKEVKDSIAKCKAAGIRVVMMTGDNLHTASAVGKEIGLTGNAMLGTDFEKMSDEEKKKAIQQHSIFARVEPDHKLEIVRLLQSTGAVVSMTGDGVNDAPAIKHANLGIAMGVTGSDVTKEASDMILQDDNFVSIVSAIEEGRGIYTNIRKFVNYLFSSNIAEVLIVFIAILFGWDLPLTAIMLLWINLVTDGLPALALSVDPSPAGVMEQPPRKTGEGIMTKQMMGSIAYVSILITIAVLAVFYYGTQNNSLAYAQTLAFSALIVMELVRLQTIRSQTKIKAFSNKYLILAVAASFALQLAVIYTPLQTFFGTIPVTLKDWGIIIGASAIVWALNMMGSWIGRKTYQTLSKSS